MRIPQLVFSGLLQLSNRARSRGAAADAVAGTARRLISKAFGRRLVSFEIGNYLLDLPFSHELPFILARHPGYAQNIGRIAKGVQEKYKHFTMIDIGANVGDTVAIVRTVSDCPVLCIDGDPTFFSILSKNAASWPDVSLEMALIGPPNERGHIEGIGGTGHLVYSADSSHSMPTISLSDVLRRHPQFCNSKLLKVDTDGFDTSIIRMEQDLLGGMKPVIFFEYDPFFFLGNDPEGFDLFSILSSSGYDSALFYTNVGEYFCGSSLSNMELLDDLHCYALGRGSHFYWDVCAFPAEDVDLFQQIRANELIIAKARGELMP